MSDPINPKHYKHLPAEAIDIIEAAIERAPTNAAAYLQGQALKYLLRCWEKKGIEDLRKAKWYLDRLVASFDETIAEASGANEKPSDEPSEDRPPAGWKKMEIGEDIDANDKFWFCTNWMSYEKDNLPRGKLTGLHVTHIRKIETPSESPKRYREPTQADLQNGPIECEVRDTDSQIWTRAMLLGIDDINGARPYRFWAHKLNVNAGLYYAQCRIEVTE